MALKNNGNRATPSSTNQLHRSAVLNNARGLHALGNLSRINPESQPSASPFSSSYLQQPMTGFNSSPSGLPPPLPPKHNTNMSGYNRYSPVSSYFSPFSSYNSGYPGMNPYRMSPYGAGYGMSRYGMSTYGAGPDAFNSFAQLAEESTRPAFQSIESVVGVVSSISMMLESTYHAVYNTYSGIIGMVDQFSRLKDQFTQILSFLAILRWLRWMCCKILYYLGVRKENPSVDAAWDSAEKLANTSNALAVPDEVQGSAWPFLMFLSLVVGAPWLMFKLLSKSLAQRKPFDPRAFVDANGKRYFAVAAYDFKATQTGELSFQAGERLMISPRSLNANPRGGWYFACNEKQETGMIPSTYLKFSSRNNTRTVPTPQRSLVPEENVSIPSEAVSETETIDSVNIPVNSPENSVSLSIEKSADSPDVVVEKPAKQPIGNLDSKSNSSISSD